MAKIELGAMAEVSSVLGVPRSTASMWATRRQTSGFPEPIAVLTVGAIFDMRQVRAWYAGRKTNG